MIPLSPEAAEHVAALQRHYFGIERYEALQSLSMALVEADSAITANPSGGLAFPATYEDLAERGLAWVKVRRYWIAYESYPRLMIIAVFYDTANIPKRL